MPDLFDAAYTEDNIDNYVFFYCLNRLWAVKSLPTILSALLGSGGFGGDLDWGIHKWDKWTSEDYRIDTKFDGYRFYLGPDEHGIKMDGDLEAFRSEDEFRRYLRVIASKQVEKKMATKSEVNEELSKWGIETV